MGVLRVKLLEELKYLGTDIDLTDFDSINYGLKYTVEDYKKEIQEVKDDI